MGWRDGAGELDAQMLEHLLPPHAIQALADWLKGAGAQYADGTGPHAVSYMPSSWAGIQPWPSALADQTGQESTALSRNQVLAAVRAGAVASNWTEAFVATYVWGQGPNGYGGHRLREILRCASSVETTLQDAIETLAGKGAVKAYEKLQGALKGLGPAFFTKFLYFAGAAIPTLPGLAPLILDQRIARFIRKHATHVAKDMRLEEPEKLAAWLWSNTGWSPYRYDVYLRWIHGAAEQLARTAGWLPAPDLLELALFSGAWNSGDAV